MQPGLRQPRRSSPRYEDRPNKGLSGSKHLLSEPTLAKGRTIKIESFQVEIPRTLILQEVLTRVPLLSAPSQRLSSLVQQLAIPDLLGLPYKMNPSSKIVILNSYPCLLKAGTHPIPKALCQRFLSHASMEAKVQGTEQELEASMIQLIFSGKG